MQVIALVKFFNLISDGFCRFINKFFLSLSDPIYIFIAKKSNFVGETCKFLTWHNLYGSFFLFAIKTLNTLTLLLLAYLACSKVLLDTFRLFDFIILILFYFWSTRMGNFNFSWIRHVRRFDLIMLILHMRIKSCIWPISFTTGLNRAEKLFGNLLIFSTMDFRLVFGFCFFGILIWLVHK